MRDLVNLELKRMVNLLRQAGFHLELGVRTSSSELADAQAVTGIRFDDGLEALFSLADGSMSKTCLAVITDELTPCSLASLSEAVAVWRQWLPYDARTHGM